MLKDKVAIVTGASSGIGAALAGHLAREGASVVIAARRKQKLDELAASLISSGGKVVAMPTDVTDPARAGRLVADTIDRFGRLDILVNNAGRGHFASVEDTTDEVLLSMFSVNTLSLWYTTRPALRQMKKQGSGHIINIASMAGKLGYPFNSAYVAAKHACVGFTHALRMELLETNIHASVVCPAGVLTDWASVTEGGPMLPMFSASGPSIKKIAAERGISLPPIEGLLSADVIADRIMECIHHPVAEVFTHKGAAEFVSLAARHREDAERHQLPIVLGEREVYEQMKPRPR
jgi:NAD(P)-dependent dehydrogenase (short-subunit alcohol dehydrogenase family)